MFLMLLRHTKSSWSEPGMSDHDRTLNDRGRSNAVAMANYIRDVCPLPQMIICSSAVRTQETLAPILTALGDDAPEPFVTRAIYEAPGAAYINQIASGPDGSNVLVVGHNPTTESLAINLSGGDPRLLGDIATGYPTGGLTILEFKDGPWADALTQAGTHVGFTAPHLLKKDTVPGRVHLG
ncbi:MAG: histidine phosphatase family protein [Pseudomonadota bacterium]